jgi:MFS family permease
MTSGPEVARLPLPGRVLWLVVLVSCAHAMVHVYELSLPSVELKIAEEFAPRDAKAGKEFTGRLSNYWRLLWGFGALAAGWLVDRYGADRLLALYLLGSSAACAAASLAGDALALTAAMLFMGACASIYHPAGLSLISHETTAENRTRALGIHGIFGSAGIALAPFAAALLLARGFDWRQYYLALALPGGVLALFFVARAMRRRPVEAGAAATASAADERADWRSYFTLCLLAVLQGFVYSAMMSFLTRYLSHWQPAGTDLPGASAGVPDVSAGNYQAALVLLVGCVGQYLAGRFARPALLEAQLTAVSLANAPCLAWMAVARQEHRLPAAALFALVHFMHQPIYNSLIAKYTPRRRRSLCYGFSFAAAFGLGSFGSRFAGDNTSDLLIYGTLAGVSVAAGCLGLELWRRNRRTE